MLSETDRAKEHRISNETYGVKQTARNLENRSIEPRHCYMLLDHSYDEQMYIFRNALNSNKILKDIYIEETFTYQECYKIEAIEMDSIINVFLSSDKIFDKYKGQILHNVWRTAVRRFYEMKIRNDNIGLTEQAKKPSDSFRPKKEKANE